jgi:signal transduction histidine kinase
MAEKILLVDDEEGIRKVLGIALDDSGYEVLKATNGEEAMLAFREHRPPVVLTDIKMPGMDGIELLQAIKRESPDTEVIMITGHGDLELAIKSLQLEAADFITKPINSEALDIALKRAHERICMRNQLREYTQNLEEMVQEKTRKLLEAERMAAIGQTVATLAHAIKNIIGGLKGGMYVMEKGMELENGKYLSQGWEMIKGNVEKIKNLALDLLNYAKEREPDYELCDPNGPVREVYQLMLSRAKECDVNLRMELDEALSSTWLDPEGIHCCLLNLVTNALDACSSPGCTMGPKEVVIRSARESGCAVKYEVADNGSGMDEETKGKIFKSFFSTKGSKGTGLGLMITNKIVREHGGEVELESEEGQGARFILRLPKKNGEQFAASSGRVSEMLS